MEKKKKTNWFKLILGVCFFAYISLYVLNVTGYYDGNLRRKVVFTEKQIEEFEKDVERGETVDLKNYLSEQNKNYTNKASRLGYTISSSVDSFLNKGIKSILGIIGKVLS